MFEIKRRDGRVEALAGPRLRLMVEEIVQEFWQPPHEMVRRLASVLEETGGPERVNLVVSGETSNLSFYLLGSDGILLICPGTTIESNPLLSELGISPSPVPDLVGVALIPRSQALVDRLQLPKVLLVNPCVLENFPIPRLCLSIGLLASHLRLLQKADVRICDMQVGTTVDEITDTAVQLRPDLIGISISYGQKSIAETILQDLYRHVDDSLRGTTFVLGNIIPASWPDLFLDRYDNLVVATGEGEHSIALLVDSLQGRCQRSEIPGLAYRSGSSRETRRNPQRPVDVSTIPLPALDTLPAIADQRGALTLELSRGCQWNKCTFCPRHHKAADWKTFAPDQIVSQFALLKRAAEHFGVRKHVFLADEEFVGGIDGGRETARITGMARGLLAAEMGMKFDAAARVDQVFSPRMDTQWHLGRVEMWHLSRQAGLDRLFMGLESGSESQLRRLGKGIKPEDSVRAIRILSALGIPLRFGFITFDPLMASFEDLRENIRFLERTDAFMKPLDVEEIGYADLFDKLCRDRDFVEENKADKPIHSSVSYMLASLEVLIDSPYARMVEGAERKYGLRLFLDDGVPDVNMGRQRVRYLDERIGDISEFSQRWIDRNFGLAYTTKSLYKVASDAERRDLLSWMVAYRKISLELIKAIIFVLDVSTSVEAQPTGSVERGLSLELERLRSRGPNRSSSRRISTLFACLSFFEDWVCEENQVLSHRLATGKLRDSKDRQLARALDRWNERSSVWELINGPTEAAAG